MIEFNVMIKKVRDFNVYVKNFSKLYSLSAMIKIGTYKISTKIYELMSLKITFSHKTKIIVGEWLDVINPRPVIRSKTSIDAIISSNEYISTRINHLTKLEANISSNEYLSPTIKSKLKIIANPTIGIFRKLAEFDILLLSDLDVLTLEDMEYIEEEISYIEREIKEMDKL